MAAEQQHTVAYQPLSQSAHRGTPADLSWRAIGRDLLRCVKVVRAELWFQWKRIRGTYPCLSLVIVSLIATNFIAISWMHKDRVLEAHSNFWKQSSNESVVKREPPGGVVTDAWKVKWPRGNPEIWQCSYQERENMEKVHRMLGVRLGFDVHRHDSKYFSRHDILAAVTARHQALFFKMDDLNEFNHLSYLLKYCEHEYGKLKLIGKSGRVKSTKSEFSNYFEALHANWKFEQRMLKMPLPPVSDTESSEQAKQP